MKKILLLIIILFTSYGVLVFLQPATSNKIESIIGIPGFGDKIRGIGGTFNNTVTDIPNQTELKQGYNHMLSGASDIKDKVVKGIYNTKDTIDTVRSTLGEAEETYNKAKDVIQETTDTVNKLKTTLNDVEELGDTITDGVNTNIMQ